MRRQGTRSRGRYGSAMGIGLSLTVLSPISLGLAIAACSPEGDDGGAEPGPGSTGESRGEGSMATLEDESGEGGDSTGVEPNRDPGDGDDQPEAWVWELPPGFPVPYVPEDNPMSAAKVELGRHLFYDERLSVNGTTSCATCHRQELAFTDGLAQGVGATGESHTRGSMSLANIAYASTLAWGHPTLLTLEDQALLPLFGTDPIEMGLIDEADIIAKISDDPIYLELFELAYPNQAQPMTLEHITGSLASFERTLISGRSPFDRWFYEGDESAISDAAKRGYDRFHAPFECFYCHFSFNFSDAVYFADLPERTTDFHNIGLYNIDGKGAYPAGNTGIHAFTGQAEDMGRFKTPTLRNLMVTGPYMHDGSIETLEEVLAHYAVGGRTISEGPNAGIGADSPYKDLQMTSFELDVHGIQDMMALFESLTDDELLTNPAFSDPWE